MFVSFSNRFAQLSSRLQAQSEKFQNDLREFVTPSAVGFDTVLERESEEIGRARARRKGEPTPTPPKDDVVGLALSGGGIRSATFNLGVIQGLAKRGYLKQIDYLSTVSGGGYLGAWLTAWISREGIRAGSGCGRVEQILRDNKEEDNPTPDEWRYLEPNPVRFLRRFSNYLAPRTGVLSSDTWALVGVYLRNVALNLLLLIACGAAAILLALQSTRFLYTWLSHPPVLVFGYIVEAGIAIAVLVAAYSFATFDERAIPPQVPWPDWYRKVWQRQDEVCERAAHMYELAETAKARDAASQEFQTRLRMKRQEFRRAVRVRALGALVQQVWARTKLLAANRPGWLAGGSWLVASLALSILLITDYSNDSGQVALPALGAVVTYIAPGQARWMHWAAPVAIAYAVLWMFALLALRSDSYRGPKPLEQNRASIAFWTIASAFLSGGVGGLLLMEIHDVLLTVAGAHSNVDALDVLIAGPPLLIALVVVVSALHVGLLGRAFPDAKREWIARLGGMMTMTALGWLVLWSFVGYGPAVFHFLFTSDWARTGWGRLSGLLLGGGWLGSTLHGVIGGQKSKDKPGGAVPTGILLQAAPLVFIVGLTLLLSAGVDAVLARGVQQPAISAANATGHLDEMARQLAAAKSAGEFANELEKLEKAAAPPTALDSFKTEVLRHWYREGQYLSPTNSGILLCLGVTTLIALLLNLRLDVNEFSIHLLYRNRLVRCYMGASRPGRRPQPFTGFDDRDDLRLARLRIDGEDRFGHKRPYDGPYPLICTALNLVSGKELAFQKRKASSFVFSPLFCGYDYFSIAPRKTRFSNQAFRPTEQFSHRDGPYMGTAMAVSGAAATPNMGYHSSPALTFLMAVFNVRLGGWFGNTRHADAWRKPGPPFASYLLKEMFGQTDDNSWYVYLSDGGHFENLGLYELVRRKCRFIIVSDAACDVETTFADLGNAIEKCRRDFGAAIQIDVSKLRPAKDTKRAAAHYAIGNITYCDNTTADLLYLKSSLVGDEPEDVQAYAAEHNCFPQDSTAEQFFNESQFEAYRALGECVFASAMKDIRTYEYAGRKSSDTATAPTSIVDAFKTLHAMRTSPPALNVAASSMKTLTVAKMRVSFES